MTEADVELFVLARQFHADLYPKVKKLRDETQTCHNLERLVDRCLAARHALQYLEDLRKEISLLNERAEKLACLIWVELDMTENVKTAYTLGMPKVKMMAAVPKKRTDPASFRAFMEFLKVPAELYAGEHEAVRVHWPGMVDYISDLLENGKPLPDGIDPNKTYPVYSLTCRKRKEIDDLE